MKIHYKFICSIILLIGISCDPDRVDAPPLGNTEDSYFSNAVEFTYVTIGAYSKLYDYYHFKGGDYPNSLWLLPGDDLTETNARRTAEELFDGRLSPTNSRLEWIFDNTYEMIQRTNVIIQKVNEVDYSNYEGADEITLMEGEALFLRAYAYFNLFNIYGNVPIITERLTGENTNTPKSDMMEVLDQVIEDARNAIPILPESWDESYRGRAFKNSARGLLVKALVFRANYSGNDADYSEAINVFNNIDSELLSTYTDNFAAENENNIESLFEIQAAAPTAINNLYLHNSGAWRGVEDMSVYRGMMTPAGQGQASDGAGTRFLVTDKLFNAFGDDPRIEYFLREDDNEGGRIFQKYTAPELDIRLAPHGTSINNERVLRYSDIKLLVAEAMLKTGNISGAIEQVNDVRSRARNWATQAGVGTGPEDHPTSETDTDTVMDWIMNERYVELAGEGHRWWDLKRWHESGDMDLTGWTGADHEFSTELASPVQFDVSKHLLFPLPQTEISRNDQILNNNPGY